MKGAETPAMVDVMNWLNDQKLSRMARAAAGPGPSPEPGAQPEASQPGE